MEAKRLSIRKESFKLTLEQKLNALWECKAFDVRGNQVAHAEIPSKHEAQLLVHVTLYDYQGIRRDWECEKECGQNWQSVEEAAITK
jgi:hypothetical protein